MNLEIGWIEILCMMAGIGSMGKAGCMEDLGMNYKVIQGYGMENLIQSCCMVNQLMCYCREKEGCTEEKAVDCCMD